MIRIPARRCGHLPGSVGRFEDFSISARMAGKPVLRQGDRKRGGAGREGYGRKSRELRSRRSTRNRSRLRGGYVAGMGDPPTDTRRERRFAELSGRVARMEERIQTKRAEYRTDIARRAESMAERATGTADRTAANIRWAVTVVIGAIAAAVAFLAWDGQPPFDSPNRALYDFSRMDVSA